MKKIFSGEINGFDEYIHHELRAIIDTTNVKNKFMSHNMDTHMTELARAIDNIIDDRRTNDWLIVLS